MPKIHPLASLALLLPLCACVPPAAQRPPSLDATSYAPRTFAAPDPHSPLIGAWDLDLPRYHCTRQQEWRADGTFTVTSGDEHTSGRYEVAVAPDAAGFYKFTSQVTERSGGKDCAGASHGALQRPETYYLAFNAAGGKAVLCVASSLDHCYGPLKKHDPEGPAHAP
jgi:hypothetical protein